MSDVAPQPVDWLWPNRIPLGKLSIIAGDPSAGKSVLTIDMAARVSRGKAWPDSPQVPQRAAGVVLISAEDDIEDTIRPRLDAAGADPSRIAALMSFNDVSNDIELLRDTIDAVPNCRLCVIDPISAFMGRVDSNVNADVRGALAPLAELAAEKRVAIVGILHPKKGESSALYKVSGSVAYVAAPRAVWTVIRDRDDPDRRLFLPVKLNLVSAKATTGLAYTVESHCDGGEAVVRWQSAPVTISADEAMAQTPPRAAGRPPSQRLNAETWLYGQLARGPRLAEEMKEAAHAEGISGRTLDRAKQELGVDSAQCSRVWYWRLPRDSYRSEADDAELLDPEQITTRREQSAGLNDSYKSIRTTKSAEVAIRPCHNS